jgi:hypothetical protein
VPSIKQIQNRLANKKDSLNKININITRVGKSKNNIALRKLNQEKGTLDRDIKKLERQLITEKNRKAF